jgi:MFS family permease
VALLDQDGLDERSSWRLLGDPLFGPFFAGRLLSTMGVWIANIVSAILAFELSGSALTVGLVSAALFGPQLLFAPLSGAMADRGNRKFQLIAGRLIIALGSGGLAVTVWVLGVDGLPGPWVVILASGVVGMGFVVGGPAMDAIIPSLVRPAELHSAMNLNSLPFSLGRAGGPAVGVVIATTAGPATALAIGSAANALFAVVLVFLPIRSWRPEVGKDRRVRAGIKFVRNERIIFCLLAGVTAIGIGADPIITLTPSLAAGFGGDARLVGLLASAFGLGAVIAIFTMGAVRRRFGLTRAAPIGLGLLGSSLVIAGVSPSPLIAAVALVAGGIGMTTALTSLGTQLQVRLPEEFRGRVMGMFSLAFLGSRPIAATFNGFVSDATTPGFAFTLAASMVIGIALWLRAAQVVGESP